MYKYLLLSFIVALLIVRAEARGQANPYSWQHTGKNPTHKQVIDFYQSVDAAYTSVKMLEAGPTDTDDPLHVIYYSANGSFDLPGWKKEKKTIVFINNGIHPGEPDGIVATAQLLWDIVHGNISVPDNVVLAVVPVFNIHGAKSLRTATRANQNGPALTGFRGNAQNLDLNRDFMKMDAKETRSLIKMFRLLEPEVLIDNHVSNGADYQHIMTLLSTQYSKLGGAMGDYLDTSFEPAIYRDMKKRGYDLVPYVNVWGKTPDKGWKSFLETPRFLSGYAAIHHCFSFVPETHMLKPYPDRIKATYELMRSIINFTGTNATNIQAIIAEQKLSVLNATTLPVDWSIDTTKYVNIEYKGYKAGVKTSTVSNLPVMYYDREQPFTATVPYYNYYRPSKMITVPRAYIIPQGWNKVIRRLKDNGVMMHKLDNDSLLQLTVTKITDYKTTPAPYEGHYLHSNISGTPARQNVKLNAGDYYIPVAQPAKRYIVESLELSAPDGFFAWGFFDAVLQQKEYFSDYAFENLAAEMLDEDEQLAKLLAGKCASDPAFAKDADAQLDFVFQNCSFHEPEHMRYPVYRLE